MVKLGSRHGTTLLCRHSFLLWSSSHPLRAGGAAGDHCLIGVLSLLSRWLREACGELIAWPQTEIGSDLVWLQNTMSRCFEVHALVFHPGGEFGRWRFAVAVMLGTR